MKGTFLATFLALAVTLPAVAQKKPAPTQHLAGSLERSEVSPPVLAPTLPTLCKPCVFYGGDFNPGDANATGLSDENTLLVLGSSTYAALDVPSGVTVTVTGILVNVQADTAFDPGSATYDIRTGITEGNGGTSIASGTAKIHVALTGRNFLGLNEFTVAVLLPAPQVLSTGEYWFNVTPQCTNSTTDGSCIAGRVFLSNTTQETNGLNPGLQPGGSLYWNSAYFGISWDNWCDSSFGLTAQQCNAASFGLTGSLAKSN